MDCPVEVEDSNEGELALGEDGWEGRDYSRVAGAEDGEGAEGWKGFGVAEEDVNDGKRDVIGEIILREQIGQKRRLD